MKVAVVSEYANGAAPLAWLYQKYEIWCSVDWIHGSSRMNGRTKVIKCPKQCKHADQDARYGAGMRLHNGCNPGAGESLGWRCTICSNETTSGR